MSPEAVKVLSFFKVGIAVPVVLVVLAITYSILAEVLTVIMEYMETGKINVQNLQTIWPPITDAMSAKSVAFRAGRFAVILGCLNAFVKLFPVPWNWSWLEIILYILLGIGVMNMSRVAAVAGLLAAILHGLVLLVSGRAILAIVFSMMFCFTFVAGIRATFQFQAFLGESRSSEDLEEQEQ